MRLALPDLLVAPLGDADLAAFVAYRRDPQVARFQGWDADYSADDAARLLAAQAGWEFPPTGEWMQFGIADAAGALLGDVAIHALADQPDTLEVGVTIDPAAQGQGLATRALAAVVEHLVVERAAHRVIAHCDARNSGMSRVLAKLGFRREGVALEGDWFKGEWTTLESWAVLGREWRARG